jgi:hypothetical protein
MLRLRDARLLFLDGNRAHIATQSGRLVRTVGRAGGGPGEYRALAGACVVANDSILLSDATLQRISVLDASARYARSIDVSRLGVMYPNACFVDGRVVLAATEVTSDRRFELALRVIDQTGRVIVTLPRQSPGPTLPELFRGRTSVFVSTDRIVVGLGGRGTITEYRADGTAARVLSLEGLALPLLESEWWQGLESMIPAPDDASRRRTARDRFGHLTPPRFWPAFERVLTDGAGGFWVELSHAGSSRQEDWLHFDANWKLVKRVRLGPRGRSPRAVLAFDVSSAFVREFDEDGFVVVTQRLFVSRAADATP